MEPGTLTGSYSIQRSFRSARLGLSRPPALIIIGRRRGCDTTALAAAAGDSGFEPMVVQSAAEAQVWLERRQPHLVILDRDEPGTPDLCTHIRANTRQSGAAILGLASRVDDCKFCEFLSWGGDDLVSFDSPRSLVKRLRSIPREFKTTVKRGSAVIASSSRQGRVHPARALAGAGYHTAFAATFAELKQILSYRAPRVVVVDATMPDAHQALALVGQKSLEKTVWIFSCTRREMPYFQRGVLNVPNATVLDAYGPPDNVLFLANELTGESPSRRTEERLLFGTIVAFRAAGSDVDDYGFTYNISRDGLYVRSLVVPEKETLWLELRPPRTTDKVRLEARVAWKNPMSPIGAASAPPGFGLKITDGTKQSLEAWRNGVFTFRRFYAPKISLTNLPCVVERRESTP